MSDHWPRIQMIQLETRRIQVEANDAERAGDLDRLKALNAEMRVLYDSILDIRREQIMDDLPKPKPEKRRWWRRG